MNIYDFALEKITSSRSLTDILLAKFNNSERIIQSSNDELARYFYEMKVSDKTIREFLERKKNFNEKKEILIKEYKQEIEKMKRRFGIYIISRSDSNYPLQLKKIKESPLNLYVKGDLYFNFSKSIAIVGTRNISAYAREKIAEISKELAKRDFCIISGLARGTDGQAHSSTVAINKKTIAVLPFLSHNIYPTEHEKLTREILFNKGALISEYFSPNKIYDKSLFRNRNRIISGLSKAVLIVEGSEKSGSLSQYNHAKRQNKLILTLKPKTNNESTFLPKKIVEDGGKAISSAQEIIEIFEKNKDN